MSVLPTKIRPPRTSLDRIRAGVVASAVVVVAAIGGFRFIGGYGWIESLWMVVITVSTVGYSEESRNGTAIQLLQIAVILFGVTAAAYVFTGIIQMLLEGEVDRFMGRRRMKKEIEKLSGHAVICGFGKNGPELCSQLEKARQAFVVVDSDESQIARAAELGYLAVQADATDEQVLVDVQVQSAAIIVISLPSDAENVFITLSARNLCPEIRIVASAERESTSKKLHQAGADEVVMTHRMVADHLARMITRPSAAKFFDVLAAAENLELEIDELVIEPESRLVDQTIAVAKIRDRHGLLIVGIRGSDGPFEFNPDGNRKLAAAETLLIMGRAEDIDRFKQQDGLREPESGPHQT